MRYEYRNSAEAFMHAFNSGLLTMANVYDYMYMGTHVNEDGTCMDEFKKLNSKDCTTSTSGKHIDTREYIHVLRQDQLPCR